MNGKEYRKVMLNDYQLKQLKLAKLAINMHYQGMVCHLIYCNRGSDLLYHMLKCLGFWDGVY